MLMVLAACNKAGELPEQNPYRKIMEYKPATVTMEVPGAITPDASYDWVSYTQNGNTVSFTTRRNFTGLIRRAEFSIAGTSFKAVISQKSGKIDANLSSYLVSQSLGQATVAINIVTGNVDDYDSWGVIYGKENDRSKGTELPQSKMFVAGENPVTITGLEEGVDYFVWAYVVTTEGDVVYTSNVTGIVPPIYVSADDDLQTVIDGAKDYSEIRILGASSGKVYGPIILRDKVTLSGGWNADFSAQSLDDRTVIKGSGSGPVLVADGLNGGVTLSYLDISGGKNSNEGGAFQVGEKSKVTVEFCNVHDNYSSDRGGAIIVYSGAKLLVANSIFKNNISCHHGGAIASTKSCEVTIVNSLFEHNLSLKRNGYAGCIFLEDGPAVVMVNCTVVDNINWADSGSSYASWPILNFRGSGTTLQFFNNLVVGNLFWPYDADTEGLDLSNPADYATIIPVQRQQEQVMLRCLNQNPNADYGVSSNLVEGAFGWHSRDVGKIDAANYFVAQGVDLTEVYKAPASGDYTPVGAALKGEASATVKGFLGKYNTDVYGNPRFTDGTIHIGAIQAQ